MSLVRDALIVAGGRGTRMFPASLAVAKETLPLYDVPLMTHLILEAKAAGIRRIHFILSPEKSIEGTLTNHDDLHVVRQDLSRVLFSPLQDCEIFIHIQHQPKGLGDALATALHEIEGPMLILLGDNALLDFHASAREFQASQVSKKLVDHFHAHQVSTVGLVEVEREDVSKYGIVQLEGHAIRSIVEKPPIDQAPSRLALCGRYVFSEDLQELLKLYDYESYGELQSIAVQEHWMNQGALHGVPFSDVQWYDSGSPLTWLQAQIDHVLRREDTADEFRAWLEKRLED